VRRLPGPADWRLSEEVQTSEALSGLFRDWQRTQTQSSVTALRSSRPQMDVRFCIEQEPPAERHTCAAEDSDRMPARSPQRATKPRAFLLTLTYMDVAKPDRTHFSGNVRIGGKNEAAGAAVAAALADE
jgi:hypothetical protein